MKAEYALADAACNYLYASWYLAALLPQGRWHFASAPFAEAGNPHAVLHLQLYVQGVAYRIAIDHSNLPDIDETSLAWCHAYGKVNLRPEDADRPKLVAIGPLTAIRFQPGWRMLLLALANAWRARKRIASWRRFFGNYRACLRRPRLADLQPGEASADYVFFASSQWKKEAAVNELRARFIRACRAVSHCRFEGGFAPRSKGDMDAYSELEMKERLAEREYLDKTRRSALAFNTPSVAGCNGWKYCELLMMGKAILTPPLVRLMPGHWEHGHQYQQCLPDGTDLPAQVQLLLHEPAYRERLGRNARAYYEKELAADVVLQKLLQHAQLNNSFATI